jgi:hypothetical protein
MLAPTVLYESFRRTRGGCNGETPEARQNVPTIASR